MSRPLEGIRVLDLSRLLPGPFATMVLADLGASVDKVEDPKGGDYLRVMPPRAPDGMNTIFHGLNRNKRSLVLDLKRPEGRDALLRLLPKYDVLVESFRPGVLARLGLGYDVLHAAHPGLVICAITGYGQDGPLVDRAGHDLNYLARAGVLGFTGPADGPPQPPGMQVADVGGGLYGIVGVLAALLERTRTGRGAVVDVAMAEAAASFAVFGFGTRAGNMDPGRGNDVLCGGIAPYGTYATKDGGAVALAALEPKFWLAFCAGVGLPGDMQALVPGPHQRALQDTLRGIFRTRTRDEWSVFNDAHDCCLEPVLSPAEALDDPHARHRGLVTEAHGVSRFATPAAPAATGPAPRQGADSAAILEEAGWTAEEIAALRAAGATR
jgi:alpha-methylacyl-CoA racemase